MSDDYTLAVSRLLRQYAGVARRRRDLKASFDAQDTELKATEAQLKAAALELLERSERNAVTVVEGEIKRSVSVRTIPDESKLKGWLSEFRPELLRHEVKLPTLTELAQHGAWLDGRFLIEGEIVVGLEQIETPAVKITVSKKAPASVEDDEEDVAA